MLFEKNPESVYVNLSNLKKHFDPNRTATSSAPFGSLW